MSMDAGKPAAAPDKLFGRWDKLELAARWSEYPLLRLLLFAVWFRVVFLLFLVLAAGLALLAPKLWRVTPRGFEPVVRVSLLDQVQCWLQKREAREAEARDAPEDAVAAWRRARAQNVGDLEAMRGALLALQRKTDGYLEADLVLELSGWLVRLGATNVNDLGLIAETWIRCGLAEYAVGVFALAPTNPPPAVAQSRLKALFHARRIDEFRSLLPASMLPADAGAGSGPAPNVAAPVPGPVPDGFELYRDAALVLWGPDPTRVAALGHLRAARQRPATGPAAAEIEFLVHLERKDPAACGEVLRELDRMGRAGVRHHRWHWALLVELGRREEARTAAAAVSVRPWILDEIVQLALAFGRLDLWRQAETELRTWLVDRGWVEQSLEPWRIVGDRTARDPGAEACLAAVGRLRAEAFVQMEDWDGLRGLGLEISEEPAAVAVLGGYAQFLEGLADLKQNRVEFARRAFAAAASEGIRDPATARDAGERLLALGQPQPALKVLQPHQAAFANDGAFLDLVNRCTEAGGAELRSP